MDFVKKLISTKNLVFDGVLLYLDPSYILAVFSFLLGIYYLYKLGKK